MENWGRDKFDRISERWPKNPDGQLESPVFFQHVTGSALDVEMSVNILEAFGIPVLKQPTGDGALGQVVLGFSGGGVDLYVPASMLADAQNVVSGDIVEYLEDDEI